jgi:hypothetical protein
VLGMYGPYNGEWRQHVHEGLQFPIHDPAALASALAGATQDLGIVFTSWVLQEHPFTFARKVSTLDHISAGRIGWNIVSAFLGSVLENYGRTDLVSSEDRYAFAEEYTEVAYKLWEGSWEDGAVLRDRVNGASPTPRKFTAFSTRARASRWRAPSRDALPSTDPGDSPGRDVAGRATVRRTARRAPSDQCADEGVRTRFDREGQGRGPFRGKGSGRHKDLAGGHDHSWCDRGGCAGQGAGSRRVLLGGECHCPLRRRRGYRSGQVGSRYSSQRDRQEPRKRRRHAQCLGRVGRRRQRNLPRHPGLDAGEQTGSSEPRSRSQTSSNVGRRLVSTASTSARPCDPGTTRTSSTLSCPSCSAGGWFRASTPRGPCVGRFLAAPTPLPRAMPPDAGMAPSRSPSSASSQPLTPGPSAPGARRRASGAEAREPQPTEKECRSKT